MGERCGIAGCFDFAEGLGHAVQAELVELIEGWMGEQGGLLMVVARAADVGMEDRHAVRAALVCGVPIEIVVEDGADRAVGERADLDGARVAAASSRRDAERP